MRDSSPDVTVSDDGRAIRVVLPELSEARRREALAVVRGRTDDLKVAIDAIRAKGKDALDRLVKDGKASADDADRARRKLDETTAKYLAQADELLKLKEG